MLIIDLMKYMNKYGLVVLSLILSTCVHAYSRQDHHHVITSVAGSYTGYLHDYNMINSTNSSNWDVFVGYEFEHSYFILQSGMGARYTMATITLDNYRTSLPAYDTQGKMFEYVYDFIDRRDEAKALSLNIPLLAGAKYSCAYFLAGIVNNILLWEDYSINTLVTCTGVYDRYIGDFSGMDNHAFYKNESLKRGSKSSYIHPMYQLYPYLEVGVDIVDLAKQRRYTRQSNGLQIRLAAFTQVGSLNVYMHAPADMPYMIDKNHPYALSLIEIPAACYSNYVAKSYFRDWSIGVRLSVLFDVSHGSRFCLTCNRNNQ